MSGSGIGITSAEAVIAGAVSLSPEGATVTAEEGGSVRAARLALVSGLRPIEGLAAEIAPGSAEPVLSVGPSDGAASDAPWQTTLALPMSTEAFRIVSEPVDTGGPAIDLSPGRMMLSGVLTDGEDGRLRVRLRDGEVTLPDAEVSLLDVGLDLRMAVADFTPTMDRLSVSARRVIDESVEVTRFVPLSLEVTARGAPTGGAPDRLRFQATVRGGDGAFVLDADGTHDPNAGRGDAEVILHPIRFVPGGLQPADLSPAAAAFLQEVTGLVSASDLAWPGGLARTGMGTQHR